MMVMMMAAKKKRNSCLPDPSGCSRWRWQRQEYFDLDDDDDDEDDHDDHDDNDGDNGDNDDTNDDDKDDEDDHDDNNYDDDYFSMRLQQMMNFFNIFIFKNLDSRPIIFGVVQYAWISDLATCPSIVDLINVKVEEGGGEGAVSIWISSHEPG